MDERLEAEHGGAHEDDSAAPAAGHVIDLDRVEGELADVERALARLDDGTYGTCEACGAAIDDASLESDPVARLCAAHSGS